MEMLSDDGDLYSDDDEPTGSFISPGSGGLGGQGSGGGDSNRSDRSIPSAADRRAHHNALERKRRDHIKDSFSSLRDSVPSLQGEKASRAQILKKAAEYIQFMRKKTSNVQTDIEQIKKENKMLEDQIRLIEKQRSGGSSSASSTPTPPSSGGLQQLSNNPYSNVQSMSLLNNSSGSESNNGVSPSYGDNYSENSDESGTSNDLSIINGSGGGASTIIATGNNITRLLDSPVNGGNSAGTTTATVIRPRQLSQPLATQQTQLLINGTNNVTQSGTTTIRATHSALVKNGTSTIIVQNPQIKTVAPGSGHVIHVPASSNNHNSNMTTTPIIISTSSLAATNGGGSGVIGVGNTISHNSSTGSNTFTVLNKGSGALSLAAATGTTNGAYRAVVVQPVPTQQQQSSGTTTTPNIHIVSAIPSTYSGRTTTPKRFKISTENTNNNIINNSLDTSSLSGSIINSGSSTAPGSGTNSSTNSSATAQPQAFNITSVSS